MTITPPAPTTDFRLVAIDLYRDIHKGIRAELFATTLEAGRVDPTDRPGRQALADRVDDLTTLLATHAEHEDGHVQPAIEVHMPALAERIESDHGRLEARMEDLRFLAEVDVTAGQAGSRLSSHHLYLELASFTSAYLDHQDLEERVVMPDLESAIGAEAVEAIHGALISSIPPELMAQSLAIMLPAMNIDNRAELLGGMQAGAPAEVFAGVWGLTGSVLAPADLEPLGARLGLS